jgi:hypothetical protein
VSAGDAVAGLDTGEAAKPGTLSPVTANAAAVTATRDFERIFIIASSATGCFPGVVELETKRDKSTDVPSVRPS